MTNFLFEIRCEEIPARMQAGARAELKKLFDAQMANAGLKAENITIYSTPRRLALIARGLPRETAAISEEAKGPPQGAPDAALDGFCRKNGVERGDLELRDVKGRMTYFAIINKAGRPCKDVLAEAIPAIIKGFSWPKSMRWGADSLSTQSLRWVRPLSGIIALFGDDIVECHVDGIASGRTTMGHRFHSSGEIIIDNADDYAAKLRNAHVIIDHEERQNIIRDGAKQAANDAGLSLIEDEGLVIENAGLTEWPVPLLGRFDDSFLDVPAEVIQLTARVNQKYFVVNDAAGNLTNAFICTANIAAHDGGKAIVAGNEKVLAARLSDAKFFWELDQKTTLADHGKKLQRITFHEKLGTVADKVERVARLARWLCEAKIINADPDMAEQAAKLCKADLVTEMVGEFPELQGLMGGYYAEKEGLPIEISNAIRDHYKPVGQNDDVPTAPVTVAVSLADKLDTLCSFFDIEEFPTGSKDPFALRRAAIALVLLIRKNDITLHFGSTISLGWLGHTANIELIPSEIDRRKVITTVPHFIFDRLEVMMRDEGLPPDFIAASRNINSTPDGRIDIVLKRASALQAFVETYNGSNLLAGYKRAANILKQAVDAPASTTAISAQAEINAKEQEKALLSALASAEPLAAAAIEEERFADAMSALSTLRGPIDAFFDAVMVNDEDENIRNFRLSLLLRFRDAVHQVADFSKVEG
ncbi:glycine--tRNA ligase subunit beta [Sphingorhabdus lutea]|uniref:Glycine--tRNA ligase beta subunit n=1 Tax=Sphingorhabdus lutea TaxID=1913578 RepID=A0A1L3J906_9SPHN|nr:glycine--tRNA ligase subunit beta [Sphingorhabdus lutea]APG61622.1 glycine--tRNA ligase subunit beta [Sphingorhabdus lutea]